MIALAIAGPIAAGKTTVLRLLSKLGAATRSADEINRELTATGQPALVRIFAEFGDEYRRADGSLDRARLRELIFTSREARERLEAILHPLILRVIRDWLEELRARPQPPPVAAVEVLRLPAHLHARELFDVVWLCSAPEEVRLRRLIARDGLSEAEAHALIRAQREQAIETCQPDAILDTSGSLAELRTQVKEAWLALVVKKTPNDCA